MRPARYTVNMAAMVVSKDADTLTRWRKTGVFVPSDERKFGNITVPLYTDEDIAQLRILARKRRVSA